MPLLVHAAKAVDGSAWVSIWSKVESLRCLIAAADTCDVVRKKVVLNRPIGMLIAARVAGDARDESSTSRAW